jgi:formylglycine-generating enzyme required for sulfatase activity
MNCLQCGKQIQGAVCSHCGYAVKEGYTVLSLFALNIDAMNAELKEEFDLWTVLDEAKQREAEFKTKLEVVEFRIPKPDKEPSSRPAQGAFPDGFVYIKGGTFMMGSRPSELRRKDDEVQHSVTVSCFYMGKYAVTQKEWRDVMEKNPKHFKGDTLPADQVNWFDAVEFCNKKSRKEGLTPAYIREGPNVTCQWNANGYRLPTEAEWEYACRAGSTTPFNTGNNITTAQANYCGQEPYNNGPKGEYLKKTTPVGNFPPNPWGFYDMHGNMYEWCWDWYGPYYTIEQYDPSGAPSGTHRVLRGGCYRSSAYGVRSAMRVKCCPGGTSFFDNDYGPTEYGFRLVCPSFAD